MIPHLLVTKGVTLKKEILADREKLYKYSTPAKHIHETPLHPPEATVKLFMSVLAGFVQMGVCVHTCVSVCMPCVCVCVCTYRYPPSGLPGMQLNGSSLCCYFYKNPAIVNTLMFCATYFRLFASDKFLKPNVNTIECDCSRGLRNGAVSSSRVKSR